MTLLHDSVAFHNVASLEPVPGLDGLRLQRIPKSVRLKLGFKDHSRGRFHAERASGCEIRFVTSGPFVRVTLSAHENEASVLVYKGDHAHSRHTLPAGTVTTLFLEAPPFFSQVDPAMLRPGRHAPSVWRLLFNQDAFVHYHHIESFGHELRPPCAAEGPSVTWLAYGSSITFGGNALFPANTYVQHASRLLGVDVFNKGLPGSALCEPEIATWLAGLPGWQFATLELGVNLAELASPDEFAARARTLVTTLHHTHPDRPLYLINIYPNRADHLLDRASPAFRHTPIFNTIVRELAADLAHPSIRFIDGRDLLPGYTGLHTDLIHPSDEGHLALGRALASRLAQSLTLPPPTP